MKGILVLMVFWLAFPSASSCLHNEKVIDSRTAVTKLSGLDTIEIPFIYSRHLVLIKGSIGNLSGYWILDTGAPQLVINNRYATEVVTLQDKLSWDAAGKAQQIASTTARNIRIGGLHIKRKDVFTVNLSTLEKERNVTLLGLVGLQVLISYEVIINSSEQILLLTKNSRRSNLSINHADAIKIPFKLSANKMILEAVIGERRYKLLFDTGAETSILSRQMVKKCPDHFRLRRYSKLITSNQAIGAAQDGVINELAISDLLFTNLRVLVHHFEKASQGIDESIHGAIGYELLRIGVVHIDFRGREISIVPMVLNSFRSSEIIKGHPMERPFVIQ